MKTITFCFTFCSVYISKLVKTFFVLSIRSQKIEVNSYAVFCDYNHKMSHLVEKIAFMWATLRHFDGVRVKRDNEKFANLGKAMLNWLT